MPDHRITYTRRHAYRTRSNRIRPVKLPGGRIAGHYVAKRAGAPKCGDCKKELTGLPVKRPMVLSSLKRREMRVSRAYGGSRCGQCVRERIMRAFLVEEQQAARQVIVEKRKKAKKSN